METTPHPLRAALASRTWFGFDLDDTLHAFRAASGSAARAVFAAIHARYPATTATTTSTDALASSYASILKTSTAGAFADPGKTSADYRRERFALLLSAAGVAAAADDDNDAGFLAELVAVYKDALRANLQRKPGALELLQQLKAKGKRVAIVTEGPRDAQEWTVGELGLAPYVDALVTTNEVGRAKVDGLFEVVLERLGIGAGDMVYIGDSVERDIVPATRAGILAILYDEKAEPGLEVEADAGSSGGSEQPRLRTNALARIGELV